MSERIAKLTFESMEYDFPIVRGSEGEMGMDIRKLRDRTGIITLDEGFGSTGSTKSAITYIDGEQGILRYRGYPIEELCGKANFMEVAYLLIYGELPNEQEYEQF
ncbi:MAG: citrate/2-methylcitrate synthase, partial [Gammaproteobacteria bacterium]